MLKYLPRTMKYKTLGDVVNEALIEYSPPKGRKEKIMNSLEHFVVKHKPEVTLGSALAISALGYAVLGGAGDYVTETFKMGSAIALSTLAAEMMMGKYDRLPKVMESIQKGKESGLLRAGKVGKMYGLSLGFMLGVPVAIMAIPYFAGKGLYRKIRSPEAKEKIGKIFRYPKTVALGITSALYPSTILKMPERIGQIIELHKNADKDFWSKSLYDVAVGQAVFDATMFLSMFACFSIVTYIFRDFEKMGKKGLKTIAETAMLLPLRAVGAWDREKQIEILRRKIEKTDSFAAKLELTKALLKKSPYDGIDYFSQVMEDIEKKDDSPHLSGLKKWGLGTEYATLFRKKDNWVNFFAFLDEIAKINPEAAKEIIRHARDRTPDAEVDAHLLMARISEKYFKEPQAEHYNRIAKTISRLADEGGKVKRFESSEGVVEEVPFSRLTRRKLLKKNYSFDFSERFLNQVYEDTVFKNSTIGTESPLAFENENGKSWMMVTREGKENLREELMRDKSLKHTEDAFKEVVSQGLVAQKMLYKKLREENGQFYADVLFNGQNFPVKIGVLDLESHLLQRAFVGDEKRGARWGHNDYLGELIKKIGAFREENYSPIIMTLNHGDYFTTNLIPRKAQSYARIDPRHLIADSLFDMTYISLDPVFLRLKKEKKAEIVFSGLKELYGFDDEKKFMKSFDYLYGIQNGMSLAASQQANGLLENAAMILNEVVAFCKGKPFENDFLRYMENSRGRELLRGAI